MNREEIIYYVLKVKNSYLQSVWEEWEEDINYSFTENLSEAMNFSEWELESHHGAPKYLWNEKEKKTIHTLEEACKYFGGKMKKVSKVITWNES